MIFLGGFGRPFFHKRMHARRPRTLKCKMLKSFRQGDLLDFGTLYSAYKLLCWLFLKCNSIVVSRTMKAYDWMVAYECIECFTLETVAIVTLLLIIADCVL